MESRRWSIAGPLGDAVLGLAVMGVLAVVISAGQGGQPQPLAYLWALGLGAVMLVRRRYPRVVLLLTALGLIAYYAAGYPVIGIAVPVAAALFSAAEAGRLAAACATGAGVLVVATGYRLLAGQDASFVVGYELVSHVSLMAAAIALGDGLRNRRALVARQREVVALTARREAELAERRRREERLAVARDLHDTLGHSLAVISLHSDVAREALELTEPDDAAARAALTEVKRAGSRALTELRQTVAVLRADEADGPSVSLADLDRLLLSARRAGLMVESTVAVEPNDLAHAVDVGAYRIVQEAVTNVVRHSAAEQLTVDVAVAGDQLLIMIGDDGRTRGGSTTADDDDHGHGIIGMAERAAALGGSLRAGRESTGFVVRATIPTRGSS